MQKLNPLNDFIFQKVFGEKGSEEELLSLLNAILYSDSKDKLISVEILENKTFVGELIKDRTGILDVRGKTNKGSYINIEVQRKNYKNMDKRSPFYWAVQFAKAIKEGTDFIHLPKIIAINILDFAFFTVPSYHTTFRLREDTYKDLILTDVMELHYIEMPKFRKLKDKNLEEPLQRWLSFFNENLSDDELKELIKMDATIGKAVEKINFLASDEETVRIYQAREMAWFDEQNAIADTKIEIALEFLKAGATIEMVAAGTKLSIDVIQELKADLDNSPE